VRDARRRLRRERERAAEARMREFQESQRRVKPCARCGRRAAQLAIIDVSTEARAGGRDLGAGKPGCPECIGGLPGEYVERGAVHTIRFADAPTREELKRERERR
jgi:hypothetical protein